MSLEYYLLRKKKYDDIVIKLTEIIEKNDNKFFYTDNDGLYIERLKLDLESAKCSSNYCYKMVQQLCNHHFVKDMIDISPERSVNITYCSICEYTI
jgi:hypothetical protein